MMTNGFMGYAAPETCEFSQSQLFFLLVEDVTLW
jgi:hypothetical protein